MFVVYLVDVAMFSSQAHAVYFDYVNFFSVIVVHSIFYVLHVDIVRRDDDVVVFM